MSEADPYPADTPTVVVGGTPGPWDDVTVEQQGTINPGDESATIRPGTVLPSATVLPTCSHALLATRSSKIY